MSITALPQPPTRSDPVNFNPRADAFLSALPTFATEANELQADVNAKQTAAALSASNAAAAELAANAAANATAWVSGTTYAVGDVRYSPITFLSYRRKTAGAGTTDPSADSTNWQLVNGTGNVDLNSTQTLTNKEIGSGSTINGVPVANLVNTTANQTLINKEIGSGSTINGVPVANLVNTTANQTLINKEISSGSTINGVPVANLVNTTAIQTLINKEISSGSTINGVPVANLVNTTAIQTLSNKALDSSCSINGIGGTQLMNTVTNQTVNGNKNFTGELLVTGTLIDSSATEAQVVARKTGTGASDTYLFNNSAEYGIYDSDYGALIIRNKLTGFVSISGNTTNTINAAIAGSAVGSVGTYALMKEDNTATRAPGDTLAGSSLQYAHASGGQNTGLFGSGTWRCMGHKLGGASAADRVTVWLRIS